ncbi:MAG: DUF2341 domain-containing protein [Planctomycetota bacterium]
MTQSPSGLTGEQLARLLRLGLPEGGPDGEKASHTPGRRNADTRSEHMPEEAEQDKPRQTDVLAGYRLVAKIGEGGMGAVYKAIQLSMDRPVALKVLPQRLARNAQYVERFVREARAAARLNHPNIVQVYDAGEASGHYFIAMEFVDGRSVAEMMAAEGRVPGRAALEIARDVARALQSAHDAGIIHRDVKPDNILVAANGTPKLSDLGIAREQRKTERRLTQAGVPMGTPDYISPEQVRGEQDVDGRADIYSLGATLYHMLVGMPPYGGTSAVEVMSRHLTDPAPDPRAKHPPVSAQAARIVRRAMAKAPARRYSTAAELVADIDRVIADKSKAGTRLSPRAVTAPSPAPPWAERRVRAWKRWAIVGGSAAALLLAVVLLALFAGSGSEPESDPASGEPVAKTSAKKNDDAEEAADRKLLGRIRAYAKAHPQDYQAVMRRYNRALKLMATPVVKYEVQEDMETVRRARDEAAEKALARARQTAAEQAKAGDYDAALAAYDAIPRQFASLLSSACRAERTRLETRADEAVTALLKKAKALAGKPQYDAALALLTEPPVRYRPAADRLKGLREQLAGQKRDHDEELEAKALALAKKGVLRLLDELESAAASGEPGAVERRIAQAEKNEALKPAADERAAALAVGRAVARLMKQDWKIIHENLRGLAGRTAALETGDGVKRGRVKEVTDRMIVFDRSFVIDGVVHNEGKVEKVPIASLTQKTLNRFRPKVEPKTPDEGIAAAILALPAEDVERMKTALAAAAEHPLHERYYTRYLRLRLPEHLGTAYSRKRMVRIGGLGKRGTDRPTRLTIPRDDDMRKDGADIRFCTLEGKKVRYWIERAAKTEFVLWVKLPSLPAEGATLAMYYGSPDAKPVSNGHEIFAFFDDFRDGLDKDTWKGRSAGVKDGIMRVSGSDSNSPGWLRLERPLPNRVTIGARMRVTRHDVYTKGGVGLFPEGEVPAENIQDRLRDRVLAGVEYNYFAYHTKEKRIAPKTFCPVPPKKGVSLCPFWNDTWFRQSLSYDGTADGNNVRLTCSSEKEKKSLVHTGHRTEKRVQIVFAPWCWAGSRAVYEIDWIHARPLAAREPKCAVGEETVLHENDKNARPGHDGGE